MDRLKKKMQERKAPAKPAAPPCPYNHHENGNHWAGVAGWVPCRSSR
jgi:hypothetical protein